MVCYSGLETVTAKVLKKKSIFLNKFANTTLYWNPTQVAVVDSNVNQTKGLKTGKCSHEEKKVLQTSKVIKHFMELRVCTSANFITDS